MAEPTEHTPLYRQAWDTLVRNPVKSAVATLALIAGGYGWRQHNYSTTDPIAPEVQRHNSEHAKNGMRHIQRGNYMHGLKEIAFPPQHLQPIGSPAFIYADNGTLVASAQAATIQGMAMANTLHIRGLSSEVPLELAIERGGVSLSAAGSKPQRVDSTSRNINLNLDQSRNTHIDLSAMQSVQAFLQIRTTHPEKSSVTLKAGEIGTNGAVRVNPGVSAELIIPENWVTDARFTMDKQTTPAFVTLGVQDKSGVGKDIHFHISPKAGFDIRIGGNGPVVSLDELIERKKAAANPAPEAAQPSGLQNLRDGAIKQPGS